jgi:hypothetical protein
MAIDQKEFEAALQKKEAEKKRLQEANRTIHDAIDQSTGKVRVWVFGEAKWKLLWPIDAKEQVNAGVAALSVTEMVNPQGQSIIVDARQVDARRGEGWRLTGEKPPEPEPPEPVDITKLTIEQLRELAAKLQIAGADAMKKPELLEAVHQAQK